MNLTVSAWNTGISARMRSRRQSRDEACHFQGKSKRNLAGHIARARHCNLAELSALTEMSGEFRVGTDESCGLMIHTEKSGSGKKSLYIITKNI